MSKMARSTYGLSTQPDNWQDRAACLGRSDLFLLDGQSGEVGRAGRAVHMCLNHCPVLDQCRADAAKFRPVSAVQAGVRYGNHNRDAAQPRDPGCGPWCRETGEKP